jgi:hypothetical protein
MQIPPLAADPSEAPPAAISGRQAHDDDRELAGSNHPEISSVGIGLAASPPRLCRCSRARSAPSAALDSSASVSEESQTMICAYLSIAMLVGLLTNARGIGIGRSPGTLSFRTQRPGPSAREYTLTTRVGDEQNARAG